MKSVEQLEAENAELRDSARTLLVENKRLKGMWIAQPQTQDMEPRGNLDTSAGVITIVAGPQGKVRQIVWHRLPGGWSQVAQLLATATVLALEAQRRGVG